MNLGDKIKKYRVLRGLTQTKLGEMVGFSRTTANSRIRKYETNEMAPKADIRQKIADALDVDMSSLSDIDINTEEDVLHSLFLLEEEYGMEINKEGDKINLSFSLSDNNNQKLMGYLCNWASIKNSTADFLVFTKNAGDTVEVRVQDNTVWLTQKALGQLFDVDRSVVAKHLGNIFKEGELVEDSVCAKFAQVADNGYICNGC